MKEYDIEEMLSWSREDAELYFARLREHKAKVAEKARRKAERALMPKVVVGPLRSNSYSAWLLWWRAERGTWLFEAYGSRGNGFALSSVRRSLAKRGYIDAEGAPTAAGLAWLAKHGEIAEYVAEWRVVAEHAPMSRTERASVAARASWNRLTPEERTARARKAGLVRGAQLRKPISSSGDM